MKITPGASAIHREGRSREDAEERGIYAASTLEVANA